MNAPADTAASRCALHARDALLPNGWHRNVLLRWDATGMLTHVAPDVSDRDLGAVERARGPVIPGMPNLHSHAFQRAMAGLTEFRAEQQDNFWSWRSAMYDFAQRIDAAQLEAIAFGLYVEMVEAGYTSVCEFHYLHHQSDGRPYEDDAQLARAVMSAARRAGIGLTLLPVLYLSSGFDAQAPLATQRRFIRSVDSMLGMLARLREPCRAQGVRLGLAPHSLRAVPPAALSDALAGLDAIDSTAPIHIHIAEQTAEVEQCLAWSGQRPLQWLLDHAKVEPRWCLVHATHLDAEETRRAAATGAVAGLCPTTEANLGDGIFELSAWRSAGGCWGIGSDSHICVDAASELQWLEYSQRLATRSRNVTADSGQPHVATAMTLAAVRGGAQAAARPVAGLQIGQQADFVVLDANHPALAGLDAPDMLSSHVFASQRSSAIDTVRIAGQIRVADGRHALHNSAIGGFTAARSALIAGRQPAAVRP